jgi:hypothetical protein
MSDLNPNPNDPLVTKEPNPDPEYQKLMVAYSANPFHDITKDTIAEYVKKVEAQAEEKKPEEPLAV